MVTPFVSLATPRAASANFANLSLLRSSKSAGMPRTSVVIRSRSSWSIGGGVHRIFIVLFPSYLCKIHRKLASYVSTVTPYLCFRPVRNTASFAPSNNTTTATSFLSGNKPGSCSISSRTHRVLYPAYPRSNTSAVRACAFANDPTHPPLTNPRWTSESPMTKITGLRYAPLGL